MMFRSVQLNTRKIKIRTETSLFKTGTALDNEKVVKWKFTNKELSLLAGVLVAIIIFLTIWMKEMPMQQSSESPSQTPHVSIPSVVKDFLKKATSEVLL